MATTPLGDFLRGKRDAARPEDFGLARGARRRAPGLRRSELATLAGISVEYLVRIEQGRDRHPSHQVVDALAAVLRLDATEREHLVRLAKISSGTCAVTPVAPRPDVRPTVQRVLETLEPGIAMVTNRLGDVVAWTSGFDLLARPSGLLESAAPNLTRYVFADARAHEVFPDWDAVADERAFDLCLGPTREGAEAMRAELAITAGERFLDRSRPHALPFREQLRWVHPHGDLRFAREILELPAADAQQLVVLLPADDATAEAVDAMRRAGAPPLRAVT